MVQPFDTDIRHFAITFVDNGGRGPASPGDTLAGDGSIVIHVPMATRAHSTTDPVLPGSGADRRPIVKNVFRSLLCHLLTMGPRNRTASEAKTRLLGSVDGDVPAADKPWD